MKKSDDLFYADKADEKAYRDAYAEGRSTERMLAVEAYRLRCGNLFGNRCMSRTASHKLCDGKCWYLKQYVWELNKLERVEV